MIVKLIPQARGVSAGNIMWKGKFPMRGGKFPANHPVGGGFSDRKDDQISTSAPIDAFRARGYWASCFPEGDGITFTHESDKSTAQVAKDIAECFGWDVLLI